MWQNPMKQGGANDLKTLQFLWEPEFSLGKIFNLTVFDHSAQTDLTDPPHEPLNKITSRGFQARSMFFFRAQTFFGIFSSSQTLGGKKISMHKSLMRDL